MEPEALLKATEQAQSEGRTVGLWLEEAIREKLERDGGQDGLQWTIAKEVGDHIGRESAVLVANTGRQTTATGGVKEEGRGSRCLSLAYH